jgi:membrane protease YdiL (CAAX protease family)
MEVSSMVKNNHIGLLVLFVLVIAIMPIQAAQSVQFTPAFGLMWDQLYLWTLGLSVDLYLIKYLSISPEFFMANKKFGFLVSKEEDMGNFDYTYFLQPGVMVNYHHPNFFAGVGVVRSYQARNGWSYEGSDFPPAVVWNVEWSQMWKLKLNAGLKISKIRFTVSFLTEFHDLGYFPTAETNVYGATIGYTF